MMKHYQCLQKKAKKKKFKGKGKKPMIVAWSDSESSDNEDEKDDISNLSSQKMKEIKRQILISGHCKLVLKEAEGLSTQQVKSLVSKISKDDLIHIVMPSVNTEEEYLFKIKSLNDEIALLKYEKESVRMNVVVNTQNVSH